MGFSYVFTNQKATCPAIGTYSSHKHFRAVKIPIRQSSYAYADFTIMADLYSCLSTFIHAKSCYFSRPKHFSIHKYFQKTHIQTHSFSS
ncbi:hypothetical protein M9H77_27935 [Catharanthus roseus]|uniref:Uncharacterized protein n=1 Tax=Catharanthus roseus TaxID=4058 RepID=A0ACC0ADW8_CATRO|nr:hypothetical protein M9H77_27935 [Catharanthus roseus]